MSSQPYSKALLPPLKSQRADQGLGGTEPGPSGSCRRKESTCILPPPGPRSWHTRLEPGGAQNLAGCPRVLEEGAAAALQVNPQARTARLAG